MTSLADLEARAGAGDAAAQYALAAAYDRAGAPEKAEFWLERAAAARHPGALYTMATQRLAGPGDAARAEEAARFLTTAAENGGGAAMRQLAVLAALGLGVAEDWAAAVAWLERSAQTGRPDALRELAMLALICGGDPALAAAGMGAAAAAGDALARALAPALPGGGGAAPTPRALASVCGGSPKAAGPGEMLHPARPAVRRIRAALCAAECAYVRESAAPLLRPSAVVDSAHSAARQAQYRTSDGGVFEILALDLPLVALWRRLAAAAGRAAQTCELMQALRYRPGEEYRPHHDYLPEDGADYSEVRRAGQRAATLLVLLSDEFSGGETTFPRLGLSFRGARGDGLCFENVDAAGAPIVDSLHAGAPVRSGVKWMLTLWFRERRFWRWPASAARAQAEPGSARQDAPN